VAPSKREVVDTTDQRPTCTRSVALPDCKDGAFREPRGITQKPSPCVATCSRQLIATTGSESSCKQAVGVARAGAMLTPSFAKEGVSGLAASFVSSSAPARAGAAFHDALGGLEGLAAENLQARIRGTILMALSNTHGWLVLATGNKSELSVGYSTLYGDLAGGFALIKDIYKTDVFRLALHLNERAERELIPASIIERAPSAELRDEQLDADSLPPYPELDAVLEEYVELDRSRDELLAEGFDPDVVDRALALIDRAEYKRRQAPPRVKLRPKAFGRDRRTPITNRWQG
jgi:NAD+ synthetase